MSDERFVVRVVRTARLVTGLAAPPLLRDQELGLHPPEAFRLRLAVVDASSERRGSGREELRLAVVGEHGMSVGNATSTPLFPIARAAPASYLEHRPAPAPP